MKEERIYIRVEEGVKGAWVERAKGLGMSLSEYIRGLVAEDLLVAGDLGEKKEEDIAPIDEWSGPRFKDNKLNKKINSIKRDYL